MQPGGESLIRIFCSLCTHLLMNLPLLAYANHSYPFTFIPSKTSLFTFRAKRDIERCRDTIARLTLFNPDVTITLYDRQRRTFIAKHIRGRRPTESASRFFSCDRPEYVTPLAATRPPWRVSGWAVRPPLGHPTTARQCICVNGQPVEAPEVAEVLEYLYGDVYRVNAKLQRAFGELLALKKASNLHPMFAVDIRCDSGAAYEILRDGERRVLHAAAWRPLIEAVKAAVVTAWEPVVGQAMLSSPTAVAHNEPPHSSSHNGDSRSHTWSAPVYSGLKHSSSGALRLASSSTQRMALRGPSTSSAPMASPAVAALAGPLAPEVSSAATAPAANLPVEWPSERMSLLESEPKQDRGSVERDPASGMAAWRRQRSSRLGFHPDSSDALFSSKRPRSGSLSAPAAGSRSHASALDGILSGWVNPAMMPAAASGTSESVPSLETLEAAVFAPLRPKVLDREGFYGARALAQVDLKFVPIVCSNGVLAVVDQHAADERVCLERLRRKLIGDDGWPRDDAGACMALTTPQPLRLAADEAPLLDAYGAAAAAWGWRWAVRGGTNGCDVDVTHVPLIAHRALTSTDLRVYLHRMAETRGGAGMPEGVTRVLNSVACRSAIMFGDELGPSRAQQLVDELQQTQMCFVCAHGRPTTVPLVDLSLLRKAAAAQAAQRAVGRPEVVPLGGLKGRLLEALQRS